MPESLRRTAALSLLVPALLVGCSQETDTGMAAVADLSTLMVTVVEPAAETYWDAVGWILDGADDAQWAAYSAALTEIGRRAIEAAEAQDPQAVFDVGAEVYFVCTSCHAAYSPEILRPNQTTERSGEGEAPDDVEGPAEAEGPNAAGS